LFRATKGPVSYSKALQFISLPIPPSPPPTGPSPHATLQYARPSASRAAVPPRSSEWVWQARGRLVVDRWLRVKGTEVQREGGRGGGGYPIVWLATRA
jgi:hypothetical protein